MRLQTRLVWLKAASHTVMLFGFLVAFASTAATAAPASFLADLIFWPVDGGQAVSTETSRLLSANLGGVMAGWGLLFYLLTVRIHLRAPGLARSLITAAIGLWFLIDGVGSIAAGAPLNILFSCGFLALFMIPLWLPGAPATAPASEAAGAE